MDREGQRFSFENLQNWVNPIKKSEEENNTPNKANIIEDWMGQIAKKSTIYFKSKLSKF